MSEFADGKGAELQQNHRPAQEQAAPEGQAPAGRAPGGVQGMLAERAGSISETTYRFSGGAAGTPPMARVEAARRNTVGTAAARILRKASGGGGAGAQVPQGSGAPLGADVKQRMESKLGADLSGVRVHTGGESAQAASGFGAKAFTVGSDVHFGSGQFAPGTKEGDRLLAHELTHVVQGQNGGIQRSADEHAGHAGEEAKAGGNEVSQPHEPAEKEADAVADKVADDLHDGKAADKGEAKAAAKGGGEAKAAGGEAKAAGGEAKAAGGEAKAGAEGAAGAPAGKGEAKEKPAATISAKLEGTAFKLWRTPTSGPSAAPPAGAPAGGAASPAPAAQPPHVKQVEDEFKTVHPVTTLDQYDSMIQGLNVLVSAQSKASAHLRITKLKDAIARTKPKLRAIYKEKADDLIRQWIDDRLPKANSKPGPEFMTAATAAKDALVASPTLDTKKQADAAKPLVNYAICAPEEAASDKMMQDSGGIMKVFDVGSLWWSMDEKFQKKWQEALGDGAKDQFTNACKAQKKLVLAPPGKEGAPPFKGATVDQVFNKPLNGFVGQGKDAAAVGSFADAISRFALNPGYYPSHAMFVVSAPASVVNDKKNKGDIKIGKPSIFNLLNFDENVYEENDREYGHLADPSNPNKAGNALELTCQGYPGEIWSSAKYLG